MVSAKPIEIRRDIFVRDLVFYLLCLVGLIIFIADKTLYAMEGLYLLVVYIGYIIYHSSWCPRCRRPSAPDRLSIPMRSVIRRVTTR